VLPQDLEGFADEPALKDIFFEPDRADIVGVQATVMRANAHWLLTRRLIQNFDDLVLVEGHTDDKGTREDRFAIAELRAKAVASFLRAKNVPDARLWTVSHGSDRPTCTDKSDACLAKNRRSRALSYQAPVRIALALARHAFATQVPMRLIGLILIVSSLVAGCATQASLPDYPPEKAPADLVLVRRGTLPIIVTAPHGGREAIPAVEPRRAAGTTSGPWGGVHKGGDPNTDLLAQRIAAEITNLTGKDPYLVVVKFLRKYIDANRPPELALEDPRARPYYDYYHQSIRRFVDEVRHKYPAGLLIDVHGQDKGPDVVMRGTLNGRGVERLLRRAGVNAVTGPHGIFGQLETNGFKVFPGNEVPPQGHSEDAGFNGGYTVFTYGSHNRSGIDALQMEFGTRYRQKDVLDKSARAAASAIAEFYETYLRQPTIR